MSEMKIPPEKSSLDTISPSSSPLPTELSPPSKAASTKDSLKAFSAEKAASYSTQQTSPAPQLQTPEVATDSLAYFFRTLSDATRVFRHQLSASELTDQETRRKGSLSAADQAESLTQMLEKRMKGLEQIKVETQKALDELQQTLDEMQDQYKQQQDLINKINAGNAQEKQKYQELARAYEIYIRNLQSIGAVDQGNGNYTIPAEGEDQYEAFTQEYQRKVDTFNGYWQQRQHEIKQYNSATIAYNQLSAANNQKINEFINKYDLANYLKEKNLIIPTQTGADLRDLSTYLNSIPGPSLMGLSPVVISTSPLPSYVHSLAQFGPPSLLSLGNLPSLDVQKLYEGIYQPLYEKEIVALDQQILSNLVFWSFLSRQNLINYSKKDTIPDPFLNSKPLSQKILPAALLAPTRSLKSSQTDVGSMTMQTIGLDNTQLETMLGRALLQQALKDADLNRLKNKTTLEKEEIQKHLVDQLLVLSVGLLGNQSLQALFPSLSPISEHLASLPKDSPVFSLLFAVSFANRIQEDAKQGIISETLQSFLAKFPAFASLSEADVTKLASILTLGQLLVAGKLLETQLGLPGLLAQILPSLSPALDSTTLVSQAGQEGRQDLIELQISLKDHFIDQNYPEDQAQFLAHVGTQLTEQGLLTPSVTSLISSNTINQALLLDSVKAGLILEKYSLADAEKIAGQAIASTLVESPYPSVKHFRVALETHLKDLGVQNKSPEIAAVAVILPAEEKSLIFLTPSLSQKTSVSSLRSIPSSSPEQISSPSPIASPAPLSSPVASPPHKLTPRELIAILEKRSLQLLVPQLGTQLAKQVTEEIAKTLFGTTNPDTRDVADVKSPYSLVNVIKDQLSQLHLEQNQAWATDVSQAFKETIKTMLNFYAFSLKIMDPAYLFVYSANSGIIYSDLNVKKPIDVMI